MTEKPIVQRDSNSEQSPSDHEKHIDSAPVDGPDRGAWDPDAGLSDEERMQVDRKLLWKLDITYVFAVPRPMYADLAASYHGCVCCI